MERGQSIPEAKFQACKKVTVARPTEMDPWQRF